MSAETEAALEAIRREETDPARPDDMPVLDHAPDLVRSLERMVDEHRDGAA